VLGSIHIDNNGRKPEILKVKSRSWWQSCTVGCEDEDEEGSSNTYLKM
jgi:hypothetical protein